MSGNSAASIHARLLNRAKQRGEDFNQLLNRYAIERFLYRLAKSPAHDLFLLKGAMLFDLWFGTPHRPTRDADFLGLGPSDDVSIASIVSEICGIECDDGMTFDATTIKVEEIREDDRYGGLRVKLLGMLGNARCPLQLDIGFGDVVTPEPEEVKYPVLLADQPAPRLRVYPRATVVAEKLEAIVSLGMANSRMKDYFDLRRLASEGAIAEELLAAAIAATFARRMTPIPNGMPLGLSDEFAESDTNRMQWNAFLNKNGLGELALRDVIEEVRAFITEPIRQAHEVQGEQ